MELEPPKFEVFFKQSMPGTTDYLSSVGILLYTALHSATNIAYLDYQ